MFDDLFTETAVLSLPDGELSDGLPGWVDCQVQVMVLMQASQVRDAAVPQRIARQWTFLLRSGLAPYPGARLHWHGETLELASVEACRDVKKNLVAYRCQTV